jgi:hypothetical protein
MSIRVMLRLPAVLAGMALCNAVEAAGLPEPAAPSARAAVIAIADAPADIGLMSAVGDALVHPMLRARSGRVSVMIVQRKTSAPRSTDGRGYSLRWGMPVTSLRAAEDNYSTTRARALAQRLEEASPLARKPRVVGVTTGAEFLDALVDASREGPIANLGIYGHSSSTSLYMMQDRGFYAAVGAVAKKSRIVGGNDDEREAKLRALGARDLSDFEALVKSGAIRFAKNAVVVFTGCAVAGRTEINVEGIGARIAAITGATAIASLDLSDQTPLNGKDVLKVEISRATWVRFAGSSSPERLNLKIIDAMNYLNVADDRDTAPLSERQTPAFERLNCAMRTPASGGDAGLCGVRASNGGTLASLKQDGPVAARGRLD